MHWGGTIKKSIDNFNPVAYHDCCFCFSKRVFAKKASHPKVESVSMMRICSLKSIDSADALYDWLLDRAKAHERMGKQPVFPTINKCHLESDDDENEFILTPSRQLKLKFDEMSQENSTAKKVIEEYEKTIEKLRASSQEWYLKYSELREKQDETEQMSSLFSPIKKIR